LKSLWTLITPGYAIDGFKLTGILPRNNDAITDQQLKVSFPWEHNCLQAFTYELEEMDFPPEQPTPNRFVRDQILSFAKRRLEDTSGQQSRRIRTSEFAAVLTDEPESQSPRRHNDSICGACYQEEPPVPDDEVRWIQCSFPPCQQWFHTYCMEDVRDLNTEQVLVNQIIFKILTLILFCQLEDLTRRCPNHRNINLPGPSSS
jgi:hypothetical protein